MWERRVFRILSCLIYFHNKIHTASLLHESLATYHRWTGVLLLFEIAATLCHQRWLWLLFLVSWIRWLFRMLLWLKDVVVYGYLTVWAGELFCWFLNYWWSMRRLIWLILLYLWWLYQYFFMITIIINSNSFPLIWLLRFSFFDWLLLSLFNATSNFFHTTSIISIIISYLSLTSRLLIHSLIFPSYLHLLFWFKYHFIWFILTKRYQLLWLCLSFHLFLFPYILTLLLSTISFDFLIRF